MSIRMPSLLALLVALSLSFAPAAEANEMTLTGAFSPGEIAPDLMQQATAATAEVDQRFARLRAAAQRGDRRAVAAGLRAVQQAARRLDAAQQALLAVRATVVTVHDGALHVEPAQYLAVIRRDPSLQGRHVHVYVDAASGYVVVRPTPPAVRPVAPIGPIGGSPGAVPAPAPAPAPSAPAPHPWTGKSADAVVASIQKGETSGRLLYRLQRSGSPGVKIFRDPYNNVVEVPEVGSYIKQVDPSQITQGLDYRANSGHRRADGVRVEHYLSRRDGRLWILERH